MMYFDVRDRQLRLCSSFACMPCSLRFQASNLLSVLAAHDGLVCLALRQSYVLPSCTPELLTCLQKPPGMSNVCLEQQRGPTQQAPSCLDNCSAHQAAAFARRPERLSSSQPALPLSQSRARGTAERSQWAQSRAMTLARYVLLSVSQRDLGCRVCHTCSADGFDQILLLLVDGETHEVEKSMAQWQR